jgi:phospholipase/carboxylesterase
LVAGAGPANAATPIFLAHGTADTVVPFPVGERTLGALKSGGWPVSWHVYAGMPHSVNTEEIAEISRWLGQVLGDCAGKPLISA